MRHDHSPLQAAPGLIRSCPRHIVEAILLKPCKTCLVTQCKGLSMICLHHGVLTGMNCDSVRRVHVRRAAVLQALLCGLHLASYASALCCVQTESWTAVHALYHSISPSLSPSQYQISPMFCTVRVNCSTGAVSLDISWPANVHTTVAAPGAVPVQRLRKSLRMHLFH